MVNSKILVSGQFYKKDIFITFNETSNRKINRQVESTLNSIWQKLYADAVEAGKVVYDGDNFRLDSYNIEQDKLNLKISPLKFSTLVSLRENLDELKKLGEEYYPKNLSIGGFIKTTDNKYIFGQKSTKIMSMSSADFIGGMLDGLRSIDSEGLFIKHEEEVFEETGVSSQHFVESYIVGMILGHKAGVSIITSTLLDLSSMEVQSIFDKYNQEEISKLVFIDQKDLKSYLESFEGYKKESAKLIELAH